MWGMINALQLIVLTVLFDMKLPVNTKEISVVILALANFELINTEEIYPKIFHFTDTGSFNQIYAACGIESSNFIMLIGVLLVPIVLFAAFTIPYFIYKKSRNSKNSVVKAFTRQKIDYFK